VRALGMWGCGCCERSFEVEKVVGASLLPTDASDYRRTVIVVGDAGRSMEWGVEKEGVRLP
jgi:hypothetical protein